MGGYEDTLKDIEITIGSVPGFMKALADDVLVKEWPLFKKYVLVESKIPAGFAPCRTMPKSGRKPSREVGLTRMHACCCGLHLVL